MISQPLVTVFGGSGFIGRHLVRRLCAKGWRVRVAVRRPNEALFLKPMGDVGQVQLVQANIRDDGSVRAAVSGSDYVINLVGILFESGKQSFSAVQAEGPGRIGAAASAAGVKRVVQISAIGANAESESDYAKSKAAGEAALHAAFPSATILRPSIVFGPEDDFFNRFASLARMLPMLPLIGGGETRFQPVYVADVADAIMAVLADGTTAGKTFELGGPRVYSFRELMEIVLHETGRRRPLIAIPLGLAKLKAWFLQLLPNPMLTVDQVKLLAYDNVVSEGAAGLKTLGITPTTVEAIVPSYLWRFRPKGQFEDKTA
jgi:uncharacterized protein YbjT (DUF2867 family)